MTQRADTPASAAAPSQLKPPRCPALPVCVQLGQADEVEVPQGSPHFDVIQVR